MTAQNILTGPEVAQKEGDKPDSLVIFAHGYGSNGDDLISLAQHFQTALPRTYFVSPNAPESCPGAPGGFQWFPLTSISREERDEGTRASAPTLAAYLDAQMARFALKPSRVALVGFSQGTMMALHVGLRQKEGLAGIVGFSGSLSSPGRLQAEMGTAIPVLLVHGSADEVVPVWLMFEAYGALEALNVPVDRHISRDVAHSIGPDGLQKAIGFLKDRLA